MSLPCGLRGHGGDGKMDSDKERIEQLEEQLRTTRRRMEAFYASRGHWKDKCDHQLMVIKMCLGNLRHAYTNLSDGNVTKQKEFADGLIAPAIRDIERLTNE